MTRTVFKIARVVYYLDSPKFSRRFLLDAWVAIAKRNQSFFTHGFVEVNQLLESVIYILHEALNFSDARDPIVQTGNQHKKTKSIRSKATLTALAPKRIVNAPKRKSMAK